MFEPFFGFERTPFQRDFPVENCYSTPGFEEMVSRLKYAAEKRFFILATGDVGSGKTTALRKLVALLNPNRYRVIYISESALTPRNFYWEALKQLDCTPHFLRSDAKRQLHQVILNLAETERKVPVAIIDEGHLLGKEMLEEIRFLLLCRSHGYAELNMRKGDCRAPGKIMRSA
jgi:type II secretory pathway predicted ATPase ExeA